MRPMYLENCGHFFNIFFTYISYSEQLPSINTLYFKILSYVRETRLFLK